MMRLYPLIFFVLWFLSAGMPLAKAQCPTGATTVRQHTDVTCFGANDGTITVELADGVAPLNFELFDNLSGTFVTFSVTRTVGPFNRVVFSNVPPSIYQVVVFKLGCPVRSIIDPPFGFEITEPPPLALSATSTPDCNPLPGPGNGTGTINLTATGGTSPYTYLWSDGATSEDRTGLNDGSYTVTVTDTNGCTDVLVVTVNGLTLAQAGPDQLVCTGNTTLAANAPGPGETGTWTVVSGSATVTNPSNPASGVTGLVTGVAVLRWTIADVGGVCPPSFDEITIVRGSVANAGPDQSLCVNSTTLAGNAPQPGETGTWTLISGSGTLANASSAASAVTGLGVGVNVFRWTITSASCPPSFDDVSLTVPPAIVLTTSVINVGCFGGSNGAVNLTVTGGTAPYTFLWSNGATTEDIGGLAAGTYSVEVRDANGCTATSNATVTQPAALGLSASATSVSCFGGSNGAVNLTVAGGTAPYTFSWSNGATTEDISGLPAGTYSVTVTDANGCVATTSVTLTQPTALSLSFTQVNVSCFGGNNGAVNLTVAGGTAPYSYLWSNGATTEDISGLVAGPYSVTVTDGNGCTAVIPVTITQPATALGLSTTQTNVSCFGGSNGSVNLTVTGGTAPYGFLWSNGATTEDIGGLAAGAYSVTVTDALGCTAVVAITITQPTALALATTQVNVSCFGGSNGSIDLTVSGGTAPYSYSWSGGATTQDISGLPIGTYSVTVTDALGCQQTTSVTITQPPALTLTTTQVNIACFGATTGSINLTVAGGTAPYGFLWSTGANTEDIAGLGAGTYSVTVTDALGCTAVTNVTLTQPTAALVLGTTQVNVNCFGGNTGAINLSVSGGTPGYLFAWSSGQTTEDISGLTAGTYSVTVIDANGCTAVASVTITQPANALSLAFTQVNVSCFGGNNGSINLTVTGGTPGYSFAWSGGQTTEDISGLAAGTYTVTVTDANGCQANTSVTVTQPTPLALSTTPANIACFGAATGSVDLAVTGGTAPYSFLWSGGQTTEDLSAVPAGTYTVVVTDANGCTASTSATLTQPTAALTVGSVQTNVSCLGGSDGSITLTASGGTAPFTFAWSNGATTQAITNLAAGPYSVTVTDANGCTEVRAFTITQPATGISLSSTQVNVSCFAAANGSINLTVSGGTAPYSYLWSGGQTTQDIGSLAAGSYSVTVTDVLGCSAATTVTITQPLALGGTAVVADVACFGQSNGSIDVTPTGGTAPYNYLWSTGSTSQDVGSLPAGTYQVTIRDVNGCEVVLDFTVGQPASLTAVAAASPVSCFGGSNGLIDLTVTGGTAPYTFLWSNGATSEDVSSLAASTYSVTIADANGCTTVASATVTQPAAAVAIASSQTNVTCSGGANGALNITVSGGTAPYGFAWSTGDTSEDVSGLAAGSYSVTVTDANGCQQSASFSITEPTQVVLQSVSSAPAQCIGIANGQLVLTGSGGGGTFAYSLNGGAFQSSGTFGGLAAQDYSVVVRDQSGCESAPAIVTVGALVAVNFTPQATSPVCNGGSNGMLEFTGVTGGTSPYEYSITQGNVFQSSPSFSGLASGLYEMIVRDGAGCQSAMQAVSVLDPDPLVPTIRVTNATCVDGDGALEITAVSGGNGTYSYSITGGAVFQTNPLFTSLLYTPGPTGYDVVVRDGNGCTSSPVTTLVGINSQSADIDTLYVNRTASVPERATGRMVVGIRDEGNAPYEVAVVLTVPVFPGQSYSSGFQPAAVNPVNSRWEFVAAPLFAGEYRITIRNQLGCERTFEDVLVPPDLTITIPTIFTPNGDGINDTFFIRNKPDNAFLVITNRWGRQVFSSRNYQNDWAADGLSEGVYFYRLQADGQVFTGWVEIVR